MLSITDSLFAETNKVLSSLITTAVVRCLTGKAIKRLLAAGKGKVMHPLRHLTRSGDTFVKQHKRSERIEEQNISGMEQRITLQYKIDRLFLQQNSAS